MDNDKQILAKINQRERQILVHAYLYYKNNRNLISDDKYDQWSFELADLIKKYGDLFKKSAYPEAFKDFIPDSGYYLTPEKYPEVVNRANWLWKVEQADKKKPKEKAAKKPEQTSLL